MQLNKNLIKKDGRVIYMIDDKICELRDKLNKSIIDGVDYGIIYKISVELDDLIAEYYREEKDMQDDNKKALTAV